MEPEYEDSVIEEDNTDLQTYVPKRSAVWLEGIGCTMYIFMILLTLWGIIWSFHRHGPIHGAAALFVPPYAWYCGVVSIWEEPRWKEGWDVKTETIGTIVTMAASNETNMELIQFKGMARNWISSLPKEEKERLRKRVDSFGDALIQCGDNLIEDISIPSDLRPITHSSVEVFVKRFSDDRGLLRAWDQLVSGHKIVLVTLEKLIDEASSEEFHEAIQKNDYLIGMQSDLRLKKIRDAIADLFDEDHR